MSGVVKGVKKVFKKVFKVARKIAPGLALAGAVWATAGAAGLLAPGAATGAAGVAGTAGATGAAGTAGAAASGGMAALGSSVAGGVGAGMESVGLMSGLGGGLMSTLGGGIKGIAGWMQANPLITATAMSGVAGAMSQRSQMAMLREQYKLRDEFSGRRGTYFATDPDGTVHADAPWLKSGEELADQEVLRDPKAYYDGTADQLAHTKRFPTPPVQEPQPMTPQPPMASPMAVPGVAQDQIALGPQGGQGVLEMAAATQPGGVIEPNQMTVSQVPRWTWEEQYV